MDGAGNSLSRRRLLAGLGTAAAVAAVLPSSGCTSSAHTLVCRHQRRDEVYAELAFDVGSRITHSWVHSIELSRWTDTFEYDGDSLMLITTEFQEYGAGMPLDEGDVTVEDGRVRIENIDRQFEAIRWIHSHRADYRIGVDGDDSLIDPSELPDREPLELRPR